MAQIKALTVQQPWAWAIVMGYKDVENRPRQTSYRGPLLIHAAQRLDARGFQHFWELGLHKKLPDKLRTGGIIGEVELVDCIDNSDSPWAFPNHWHWVLERPRSFKGILECRGAQTIFVPDVSSVAVGQARRHAVRHRQR